MLLVSVCASFVPLPAGPGVHSSEKDRSQPFPCQDRPCGCRSAQQCWKKCCCFTNAQKLAWAQKYRVKVPESVLTQLAAEKKIVPDDSESCQSSGSSGKANCCEKHRSEKQEQEPVSEERNQKAVNYQIGIFVQQCQGQGAYWNSLPWCVVPQPVELSVSVFLILDPPVFIPTLPADVCFSPPVPPPRQA